MKKLVGAVLWQWTLIAMALFIILMWGEGGFTGNAVLNSDDTQQFAPPYDGFTGSSIIQLSHNQVDNNTYHVEVRINQDEAYIYHNLYYYTNNGWQQAQISPSNEWISRRASIGIEGPYTDHSLVEGDDFYLGVWTCKGVNEEWKCGCKDPQDCGYWHVQGIDLEVESETPVSCNDGDGDGYGDPASSECFMSELDCNDQDSSINPGLSEVLYNGVNDDCDPTTLDDDLDEDGYILIDDCDDNNPLLNPAAVEICGDLIDQNCDEQDLECEQCGEGSIPSLGCECAGQAEHTGYCCDNNWQDVPCGTPEVVFYDGFESGTANTWDYLNPYSQVSRDIVHSGQFSLNFIYTPGMAKASLNYNQYASTDISAQQHLYFRWYQNFEADFVHPTNELVLNTMKNENSDWKVQSKTKQWQGKPNLGRLLIDYGNGVEDTGKTLTADNWHCIEIEVLANDAGVDNGMVRVWVNDVEMYIKSGLEFGDGSLMNYYEQGGEYIGNFGSVPIHSYVDDIVISKERVGC